ncbi:UPF0496 protein 4-like [Aristolochia californica]|uniref:UPF0496 protein 4-like n=1 Tax=Aristolochia californica TaxID=171875 RepID=UPI0035D5B5B8
MGRRVLFKCLPTFKFRGSRHLPSSDNYDEYARGFCFSLSEDLENLGKTLVKSSVSLKWAAEAMNLLKRMQVEFFTLVEKLKLPISLEGEDWLDHYMKETVALLDFCNLLKTAISPVERHCLEVEFMARRISDDPLDASYKAEIKRLEGECGYLDLSGGINQKLQDVRLDTVISSGIKFKKGTNPVLYVVNITMIIVSLLVVSAVVAPVSIDMDGELRSEFPQMFSFVSSLRILVCAFRERIRRSEGDSGVINVSEHEMVQRAFENVKAQANEDREKVLRSLVLLKKQCIDLKEGLEAFGSTVDEVFEEVIKGRKKMMDMFNASFVKQ